MAKAGDIYFADVFGVSPEALDEYGAFNVSLLTDLPLFVDPFLLFNSKSTEYQRLHDGIVKYLRFLRDRSMAGPIERGLLESWFTFHEVRENWLGFCRLGNRGSGLGRKFAFQLNKNLASVFSSFGQETVTRGTHLEKLCLVSEGVGRDNISDFTTTLIKEFLLRYTEQFARMHVSPSGRRQFRVSKVRFNYDTESWESDTFDLPSYASEYVLLTPKDLLTREEIWINRAELLDRAEEIAVALPDESLRAQVNNFLAKVLTKDLTKEQLRAVRARLVKQFPNLIEHYIRAKEDSGDRAVAISADRVRQAHIRFYDEVQGLRALLMSTGFYQEPLATLPDARSRAMYLKHVIEDRDGYRYFWVEGKPVARESDLQIMYDLTWFESVSDVNREVNNGRGPADFKVSRGAADSTIVEFKLASNRQLKSNLEKQVPIYQQASRAGGALKVITYFSEAEADRVSKILKELSIEADPNIILIDARRDNKPSASKA